MVAAATGRHIHHHEQLRREMLIIDMHGSRRRCAPSPSSIPFISFFDSIIQPTASSLVFFTYSSQATNMVISTCTAQAQSTTNALDAL
jgi:hypothetical protein